MDQTSLDLVKVTPQEPRWSRAAISDNEDFLSCDLHDSSSPPSACAALRSLAYLNRCSGTSLWEKEVNAGNGERVRVDVYGMTFGVGGLRRAPET